MTAYINKGQEEVEERHEVVDTSEKADSLQLELKHSLAYADVSNSSAFKGDDSDGRVGWTVRKLIVTAMLAMLYTGSQLILYFVGGSLAYVAEGLNSPNSIGWLPVANTLAIGAICPFVGYLQDLFGKRYIALFGALLLCVGAILLGTANGFNQATAGMALAGAGAGIGELSGLAGMAEIMPLKHRGYAIGVLTLFVFPFAPYVLYSQLFCIHATWRWAAWIPLIYNGIVFVGLAIFYHPHNHTLAEGVAWTDVLRQIDYLGAALSISGLTLVLVALQSGGYDHPWDSAFVLCCLLIGLLLIAAWCVWEYKFAKHPMIAHELFRGQKVVGLAFVVAFIAGMNFYSLLNFWPLTIEKVWDPSITRVGLRGFSAALAVATGAVVFNFTLSYFKQHGQYSLLVGSTLLTAFGGALAVISPDREIMTVAFGVLASFGLGGLIVPSATVAMYAAPDALLTTCAALSLSVRAVGGSVGYSIFYAIFKTKIAAKLPVFVAEYAVEAGLPAKEAIDFVGAYVLKGPAVAAELPGVTQKILEAAALGSQWAYADSLRYNWYTTIGFGALAMVASAFIPSLRNYATNRIAVSL